MRSYQNITPDDIQYLSEGQIFVYGSNAAGIHGAGAAKTARWNMFVTEIGCGLAGYSPEEIAPLFEEAAKLDNVWIPRRFWSILNK